MKKKDLDKIQSEAARIATRATKLVSLSTLSNEICWESLEQRRKNHRLTLFYKMMYNFTPLYLSSLMPETVSNISRYSLRNSNVCKLLLPGLVSTITVFFLQQPEIGTVYL